MADSVNVHFLFPLGMKQGGAGLVPAPGAAMDEEGQPAIMWGQGTPDGNLAPFNLVNKGSLYMAVNQTDDTTALWQKVDEGGESGTADWARVLVENEATAVIATGDISATAGILGSQLAAAAAIVSGQILDGTLLNVDVNASAAIAYSKLNLTGAVLVEDLETNALSNILVLPDQIDISATAAETIGFHAVAALTITEIGLICEEATPATGSVDGSIKFGTATGGGQITAAIPYTASQAVGDYQALALASGLMAAGTTMFINHVDAGTTPGLFRIMIKYDLDS